MQGIRHDGHAVREIAPHQLNQGEGHVQAKSDADIGHGAVVRVIVPMDMSMTVRVSMIVSMPMIVFLTVFLTVFMAMFMIVLMTVRIRIDRFI